MRMNLSKVLVVLVAMVPVFAQAAVVVDPVSVAEPSMFAMLGLGFATLYLVKRKQK